MECGARTDAVGMAFRYSYLKFTCWAAGPERCPIDDIGQCFQDLQGLLDFDVETILYLVTDFPDLIGEICIAASEGDEEKVIELYYQLFPQKRNRPLKYNVDCDTFDGYSNADEPLCFAVPFEQYLQYGGNSLQLVNGQDYAGSVSAYDDATFIRNVLRFKAEYGEGYLSPLFNYYSYLAANYYWPRNVPLPIRGNPLQTGIVAGQLYDPNTAYTSTSKMRENFPTMSLLTSQAITHGLVANQGPCQEYIVRYFEVGYVGFIDGTVCNDPLTFLNNDIFST